MRPTQNLMTIVPLLPVKPMQVDTDKGARANAATGVVEAGRSILPESAEWVYDFVEELAKAGPTAEYMMNKQTTFERAVSKDRCAMRGPGG